MNQVKSYIICTLSMPFEYYKPITIIILQVLTVLWTPKTVIWSVAKTGTLMYEIIIICLLYLMWFNTIYSNVKSEINIFDFQHSKTLLTSPSTSEIVFPMFDKIHCHPQRGHYFYNIVVWSVNGFRCKENHNLLFKFDKSSNWSLYTLYVYTHHNIIYAWCINTYLVGFLGVHIF